MKTVHPLNPLKNTRQLIKLNTYAEVTRRRALLAKEKKKFEEQIKTAEKKKKTLPKGHPAALYLMISNNLGNDIQYLVLVASAATKVKIPAGPARPEKEKDVIYAPMRENVRSSKSKTSI
jgi:hypothetical protein